MNTRKIGAWAGQVLLSAGLVFSVLLGGSLVAGDHGAAESAGSGVMVTASDPTWG